jgi:cardiolipin synthase
MSRELAMAAMRGVDVRIVTPGIPDKKLTYSLTRSYYADLVRYGVRIYEYTPGFIHAKQWVSDGEVSVVGTINMDFRSLYLHFENAAYVYGRETAADILNDFYNIFRRSEEVTDKYINKPRILRFGQCILRLVAPLF